MHNVRFPRVLAGAIALVAAGLTAQAAGPTVRLHGQAGRFGDAPDYKPLGNSTDAQAQWTNKVALDGKFSMLLQKSVPTADFAYAAAIVKGAEGLTVAALQTIGFSVNGLCGAGSPRFNLFFDSDGDGEANGIAFYGCANHITGSPASGWSTMSVAQPLTPDFCYDFNPTGACSIVPTAVVTSLSVLVDEQGLYYVDRVQVAGVTTGEPNGR